MAAAEAAAAVGSTYAVKGDGVYLWPEVGSDDFLGFSFGGTDYAVELKGQAARANNLSAIKCVVKNLDPPADAPPGSQPVKVMWMEHDFLFFGGSLGCAEGEKLTRGFEYACANGMPVVIFCASGGARMHEGTLSLMQMAKVSCAVQALSDAHLPFLTLLADPCYGGVSASYAMQSDVRIGVARGRLGFSGPAVILNTQFGMNQGNYDRTCPDQFQSNEFGYRHGVVDMVVPKDELSFAAWRVLNVLSAGGQKITPVPMSLSPPPVGFDVSQIDFLNARALDRYDANDIIEQICSAYIDLGGDGKGPNGLDKCLRCGLATLKSGRSIMVMKCQKGHTPTERENFNHAMPTPAGYRTCLRFFKTAEKFGLPVLSLVDTVGAWPSFDAEIAGQSEAIATNLVAMSGLKVPMLTIVVGEGGSGGALAVAMGNKIGMLSNAYYSTITPEGAASILGRYEGEEHKKEQFPKDCRAIATAQNIYAPQLKSLGVIDEVIWEKEGETYKQFPETTNNIVAFIENNLAELSAMDPAAIVKQRYKKFRAMGKFKEYTEVESKERLGGRPSEKRRTTVALAPNPKLLTFLTEKTLKSEHSLHKRRGPVDCPKIAKVLVNSAPQPQENAKTILDRDGPEAMAAWVRSTSKDRVLLTDTTMRDAHQSLAATRMRTFDMLKGAAEMSKHMHPCFSLECWGGATFDVAYRFLNEDAFKRLQKLRKAIPNICFQMLLRGANGVGYKSYPDNVVEDFVRVAAKNGMDIFRIFDCFNDVDQMKVSINAVRKAKKVAEVAMCFTGDFLSPDEKIYTLDYFKELCKKCVDAGAHMIAIKDMAGLLKPAHAKPLVEAVRAVCDLPVHFHTHNTSSAQLATLHAMADAGCDVVDGCFASWADGTSQPSLNAFIATMQGKPRDTGMDFKQLEPLDQYWAFVRDMYSVFESGMKAMTARVFDHQIPGGQYSNMYAQCRALGDAENWDAVLKMYRDVNDWCGDVVKVTPSSKSVGDISLFLLKQGIAVEDFTDMEKMQALNWPQSAIELARGEMGMPHRGFPKGMQDAILKGKLKPMVGRPGDTLAPEDFEKVKKEMEAEFGMSCTEEDLQAFLMYPAVFRGYRKHISKNGPLTTFLPTPAFFYGMEVGEKIHFEMPGENLNDAEDAFDDSADLAPVTIELVRVGPLEHEDIRTIEWSINGKKHIVKMEDVPEGRKKYDGPMADLTNKAHLASSLPGIVTAVAVVEGQSAKKDDLLFTVVSMKMEVMVRAPADCTVEQVCVTKDKEVVDGALLGKIKF